MSELKYARIKLTHATLKTEAGVHMATSVIAQTVCGYHYSEKLKCTYVYCMGQTIFPVLESSEQIDALLDEASKATTLIIS